MNFLTILSIALFFGACSATVKGVKEDSKNAAEWSKHKVNEAATAIKDKTE